MLAMNAGRRIERSYAPSEGAASVRATLRALRDSGVALAAAGAPLEVQRSGDDPPRLEQAVPLEGDRVRVRAITEPPVVGVSAFLDGIQRSQVLAHAAGVPLVHGAVAAAVRIREDRRLHTWDRPRITRALFAPIALLPIPVADALRAQIDVVDLPDVPTRHPQEITARALTAVQRAREAAEGELLSAWTARAEGTLLVDGGISGHAEASKHDAVVGVVKSHRTLYTGEEFLPSLLALKEGERTTAVSVSSPRRHPVASWYLRLRDPAGRSPLFGLVRVEVSPQTADLTARADLVSRWLLAERAPVALPDQRWDVMVYGIRECEQYLTAILV